MIFMAVQVCISKLSNFLFNCTYPCQTPSQVLLREAARVRAVLKTLESQTYVCLRPSALSKLRTQLEDLQQEFDQSLPKDSQGLIVSAERNSRLYERQKVQRKVTAARHAVLKARQAKLAGLRSLPMPNKPGRAPFLSRLRCRVGKSGEKERASLEATVVKEKTSRAVSGE